MVTSALPRPVAARHPLGDRRVVRIAFAIAVTEALALMLAAWLTGSAAMLAQTAACVADVGVGAFLLVGVARSGLPADATHPLGYGAERFYWSLFAAIGIFVAGGGIAAEEAVRALRHESATGSYAVGYAVLLVTVALDTAALTVALRPYRDNARARGVSLRRPSGRDRTPRRRQ